MITAHFIGGPLHGCKEHIQHASRFLMIPRLNGWFFDKYECVGVRVSDSTAYIYQHLEAE